MSRDLGGQQINEPAPDVGFISPSRENHPVHAEQARLAEMYTQMPKGPHRSDAPGMGESTFATLVASIAPVTSAEACLAAALAAVGWAGETRHIKEALPYFDRIRDIEGLRSVLARLNCQTQRERISSGHVGADAMPCLFSPNGNEISLLVKRNASGEVLCFDGVTQRWTWTVLPRTEGYVYRITRSPRVESPAIDGTEWLGRIVRQFKPLIFKVFLLGFAVNLLALALPLFVMHVYDLGIEARASEVVVMFSVGILIVIATDLALRQLRARAMAYFGARLDAIIAMTSFQQLLHLPISMTESAPVGIQISRLRQFESIRDAFTGTLSSAIVDIPFILIFLAAIAFIGGHLVWIPAALIVLYAILAAVTIPLTGHHIDQTSEAKTRLHLLLLELIGKRAAIRDVGAEGAWIARHEEAANTFAIRNYQAQTFNGFMQHLAQSLVTLAGIATLTFGSLSVMAGLMSLGALIGMMALVWRVLAPLQTTFLSLNRLEEVVGTVRQINRLMKIVVERPPDLRLSCHRRFQGAISINRLVFRYPRSAEPVLRGIQLQIRSGEMIAITGESGAGKSTLLKLLARLYPPTGGAILVDGLDIRQLDPAEWRTAISYAPDSPAFFYGTVAQNLRLVCPDASDSNIESIAAELGLDLYPESLPDGLETRLSSTVLDRMPDTLKQRLLLARCFLKNAAVYVLDNPAVNLDSAADAALVAKLTSLKGKRTVVFTTFRPSHMRLADRVIVLGSGQIALLGPPPQVIEKLNAA